MSSTPSVDESGPSNATTPSSQNKFFDKWRKEFSLLTGVGIAHDERVYEIARRNCERWKKEILTYSQYLRSLMQTLMTIYKLPGPLVVFMLKHLQLAGADVRPEHFPCVPCDRVRSGGFYPQMGAVVMCQGNFMSKKHMEHTMVHELVHMYDHVKFDVDWNNLRHHACSEIRANSLSGDCSWTRELQRGFVSFSKQHQACVRRRAVMSVMANPACPDQVAAERAVNEVWESCFSDTRPFDEASRLDPLSCASTDLAPSDMTESSTTTLHIGRVVE
ncbi:hypothetical protein FA95DRAFT_1555515 [Auriscalpium vulgare]|uniref:Uncharacterized protein n=1 Tax=Auriscalpium vulgare TaxID=40419 RepID=A0ACB8S3J5_9AGAM|nr:hypothetical protein FA95DRAFT_1555515 [Auriscalpium vulgare]